MNRPILERLSVGIRGERWEEITYGEGFQSSKKLRLVLPEFFISKATVWPAGQEKVDTTNELPGETVISPRSCDTEGRLLKVVDLSTGEESLAKSILPSPLKLKDEVSRSWSSGKRKTRLQVFPESEAGMSKLNALEMVELTVPLNEVPGAVSGEEESTGIIR